MLRASHKYTEKMLTIGNPEYLEILDALIEYYEHPENQFNTKRVTYYLHYQKEIIKRIIFVVVLGITVFISSWILWHPSVLSWVLLCVVFFGSILLLFVHLISLLKYMKTSRCYRDIQTIVLNYPKDLIKVMAVEIHDRFT